MKKIKSIAVVLLCVMILLLQNGIAFAATDTDSQYSINYAYDFPVIPGTEEWNTLSSLDEKLAVCQIPDEILSEMTTEALIETVADYPLSVNLYAFDTLEMGYEILKDNFNGLAELESRMLQNPQEVQSLLDTATSKFISENQDSTVSDNANDELKSCFWANIKSCLENAAQNAA